MSKRKRPSKKATGAPFIKLERRLLEHPKFKSLSPRATKLFLDMASVYNGHNNGDMSITYRGSRSRGWTSKDQLYKALRELIDAGLVIQTRQGGKHRASLYALTIWSIDECKGKLDIGPTATAPFWKPTPVISLARHTGQCSPPHGPIEGKNAR